MNDSELHKRLMSRIKVDVKTRCFLWTGPRWDKRKYPGNRYGYFGYWIKVERKQRTKAVHRWMWIALHGDPGKGWCVCHRCDNVLCINPEHLFLGTHKDNMADSRKKGRHYLSAKTHCVRGHPLSGDNLYIAPRTGLRHCKECTRERQRHYWHADPELRERKKSQRRLRYQKQKSAIPALPSSG